MAASARVAKVGAVVQQLGTVAAPPEGPRRVFVADVLHEIDELLPVAAGSRTELELDLPMHPVEVDARKLQRRVLDELMRASATVDPGARMVLRVGADLHVRVDV